MLTLTLTLTPALALALTRLLENLSTNAANIRRLYRAELVLQNHGPTPHPYPAPPPPLPTLTRAQP